MFKKHAIPNSYKNYTKITEYNNLKHLWNINNLMELPLICKTDVFSNIYISSSERTSLCHRPTLLR
jgi:hypothetical protein